MTDTGEQVIDSNTEGQDDEDTTLFDESYGLGAWSWLYGKISSQEITKIKISCDHSDGEYFFGEDATIMASYDNHSAVRKSIWMKELDSRDNDVPIDTRLQKYTGSTYSNTVEKPMLLIKNCDESDIGTYYHLVLCINKLHIYSNKINLKVVKGCPKVTLHPVPLALQNELVQIKATIRGFPKCESVIWMKDNEYIDTTAPKHEGSIESCEFPVLCIKEVNEEDDGVYKVVARNELGEGEDKEDLEVIRKTKMIFISGPAVVRPSETITFDAYFPGQGISNAKWWKLKDQSKQLLEVDNKKYLIYQIKDTIRFEITLADEDDSAAYQLSWNTKKSNRINVHVDDSKMFSTSKQGNCLRFFELQSVSAIAMRIFLDKMPGTFQEKLDKYENEEKFDSRTHRIDFEKKKDFVSRIKDGRITSSKDLDISLMYLLIRSLWKDAPKNGWGKSPTENDIKHADDIERIRRYRNIICHSDASGMDINTFNFSCLDLFRAIERLSSNDTNLMQSSCDIMNKVFTNGKDLQKMIEKLENEKKLNQAPINKDPSSPLSTQDEDRDEDPMRRTSPSPANKETNGRAQTTERPVQYADRRVSDSSDSETHDEEQRTKRPMRYIYRRLSDIFSDSFSVSLDSETHARAQTTERPMQYADRRVSGSSDSDTYARAQRTERPMQYADRRVSDSFASEIHARAQTTERPMRYVDRRLSYNLDSETYYGSERPERPMLYADRRFSGNADSVISESFFNTRITTRSGEIEPIRFHEVCDPEIMMHDNYTTAKQSNPYGDGMCFMNRPMKLEELIHIYGHSFPNALFRESRPKIKIGLTNTDPEEIREAVHQKEYYVRGLEEIKCFSDDTTDFFHIYVCLCSNATLSICVNGFPEHIYKNEEISPFNSIWLVIEPYGIDLIRILNN